MGNSQTSSSPKTSQHASKSSVTSPVGGTKMLSSTTTTTCTIDSVKEISVSPKARSRKNSLVSDYDNPELSGLVFGFLVGTPPKRSNNGGTAAVSFEGTKFTPAIASYSPPSPPPQPSASSLSSRIYSGQPLYKEQRLVNSCKELKRNRIVPLDANTVLPKSNSMHVLYSRKSGNSSTSSTNMSPPPPPPTFGSFPKSILRNRRNSILTNQDETESIASIMSIHVSPFTSLSSMDTDRNTVPLIQVSRPEEPHKYEHLSPPVQEILHSKLDKLSKDRALKKVRARELALA